MTRTRSPSRHADLRAGHLIVVGPRLHQVTRFCFPLDLLGRELEHFHAGVHRRREHLVAKAGGLCGKGFDAFLVHRIHRIGRRGRAACRRIVRAHRSAGLSRWRRFRGLRPAARVAWLARGEDAAGECRQSPSAKKAAAARRLIEYIEHRFFRHEVVSEIRLSWCDQRSPLCAAAIALAPTMSSKFTLTSSPVLRRPKIAVGGLMP